MLPTLTACLAALLGGLAALALLLRRLPDRWVRPLPCGQVSEADYFAVFALGLGRDASGEETAGASNEALADWLLANNPQRRWAVVQEGVYLALREREKGNPNLRLKRWVIRLPHDPDVYVDTAGATLQCWALASVRGLSRPAVVAHDLQQQRMAWLFERIYTPQRVVIPELPALPFDPNSVQHWGTRSRRNWLLWELLLARPAIGRYRAAVGVGLVVLAGAAAAFGLVWGLLALAG